LPVLGSIRHHLADVSARLDSPTARAWLEHAVVASAAIGFLVHLAVIGLVGLLSDLPQTIFEGLDESPLHAVDTPCSVILFYEDELFVLATILVRVSLSTPKPYDLLLALTAMHPGSRQGIENQLSPPSATSSGSMMTGCAGRSLDRAWATILCMPRAGGRERGHESRDTLAAPSGRQPIDVVTLLPAAPSPFA
jgi:hypothetical protein